MKHKFEEEVQRLNKFQRAFTDSKSAKPTKDIDLREYAKYILKEGSIVEKRELLGNLRSRLVMKEKKLALKS